MNQHRHLSVEMTNLHRHHQSNRHQHRQQHQNRLLLRNRPKLYYPNSVDQDHPFSAESYDRFLCFLEISVIRVHRKDGPSEKGPRFTAAHARSAQWRCGQQAGAVPNLGARAESEKRMGLDLRESGPPKRTSSSLTDQLPLDSIPVTRH